MPGINIGVDIGTSNVVYYVENKGIVLSKPCVTAKDIRTGRIIATGNNAYKMMGRTSDSIVITRPVTNGVIADFTSLQNLIGRDLEALCGNKIFKPNLLISMPVGISNLEKRSLLDLATSCGAASACLIEEPIAAALGAAVDYDKPKGTMIVNIGSGTTDIAVITMGCLSVCSTLNTAGNSLDAAIQRYLRHERDLIIGDVTAEYVKKTIGCAYMRDAEIAIQVKGKGYLSSLPTLFEITTTEVFLAIREQLETIANAVRNVVSETPPELLNDISDGGIILTGGSSKLPGIDKLIQRKTHIKTRVAADPENCVANGLGVAISNPGFLSKNGYIFKTKGEVSGYGAFSTGSDANIIY